MSIWAAEPAAGGFAGDQAEAFNPPEAGGCCGCCGGPATGTGAAGGQTEVCCGTAAEAQASGGCCGEAAKAEARAAEPVGAAPGKRSTDSGAGCCG